MPCRKGCYLLGKPTGDVPAEWQQRWSAAGFRRSGPVFALLVLCSCLAFTRRGPWYARVFGRNVLDAGVEEYAREKWDFGFFLRLFARR